MSVITRRADGWTHATSASAPASALDATLLSLLEAGQRWDEMHYGYGKSSLSLRCERRGAYRAEWSAGYEARATISVLARSASDALCALKLELERRVGLAEQELEAEEADHG